MTLFSLHNVSKHYGEVEVLSQVSMQLDKAEKAGLVGANGTGKTTLLKIILGLEKQDDGAVHTARGLSVGYLSQRPELVAETSLWHCLEQSAGEVARLKQQLSDLEHQMASKNAREDQEGLNELIERYGRLIQRF